jgi:hypothetical protein
MAKRKKMEPPEGTTNKSLALELHESSTGKMPLRVGLFQPTFQPFGFWAVAPIPQIHYCPHQTGSMWPQMES